MSFSFNKNASVVAEQYLNAIAAGCEEIAMCPASQVFISAAIVFVVASVMCTLPIPRNSVLRGLFFLMTLLLYLWYGLAVSVFAIRDYIFYARAPDWNDFSRCMVNKEYNEHLSLKVSFVLALLNVRMTHFLVAMDKEGAALFFMGLAAVVSVLALPALVARGAVVIVAGLGYSWAYIYIGLTATIISIVLSAKVVAQAKEERESDRECDPITSLLRFIVIVAQYAGVYVLIIALDWKYGASGFSYEQSWGAWIVARPPVSFFGDAAPNGWAALYRALMFA
jgi:hypothetical protein